MRTEVVLALCTLACAGRAEDEAGRIVFYSQRNGNDEIYVVRPDGSDLQRLTFNDADDVCAAWSPDGSKIAFASDRDGNREIYVMNADGSDQRRLTDSPGMDLHPAWSPDGTRIAFFSARDGNREIYLMNADAPWAGRWCIEIRVPLLPVHRDSLQSVAVGHSQMGRRVENLAPELHLHPLAHR